MGIAWNTASYKYPRARKLPSCKAIENDFLKSLQLTADQAQPKIKWIVFVSEFNEYSPTTATSAAQR